VRCSSLLIGLLGYTLAVLAQRPVPEKIPAQPATANRSGVYRFQTYSIMDDPRHIGGEAYTVLAPIDWRVEGSILWKNAATDPAAPWVKLIGPAHQEIGVLPPITFVWNSQMSAARVRPGSFYNGTEVQPPLLDPARCIKTIVIGRYLRSLGTADVVKQESLPDLAAAARLKYSSAEYRNAVFQAGKMRFEFSESGVAMEEDVYVVTAAIQIQAAQSITTVWTPDEIRYSKAPKGTLDAQYPLFQTAMFSLRPILAWWAVLQDVTHELGRLQAQASSPSAARTMQQMAIADRVFEMRKLAEHHANPITDEVRTAYQNRQAAMDRVNASWDTATRNVEKYRNTASGQTAELPSGYSVAWVNQTGQYLLASSPGYDPNADAANGSWTKLEKAQQ
jgi:hypothetical protein